MLFCLGLTVLIIYVKICKILVIMKINKYICRKIINKILLYDNNR